MEIHDQPTELVLIEKSQNQNGKLVTVKQEFDYIKVCSVLRDYVKPRSFFNVTLEQATMAFKITDDWIRSFYPQDIVEAYDKHDVIPATIAQDFPAVYKTYWDILVMINQNKRCNYYVMVNPIPNFTDINVSLWSGWKVTGPFSDDTSFLYRSITIKGRTSRIDSFIKAFDIRYNKDPMKRIWKDTSSVASDTFGLAPEKEVESNG